MIYECRIAVCYYGQEQEYITRATAYLPKLEEYGAKIIGGIFQTIIGDSSEVSYLVAYTNLAQREKVWESMDADKDLVRLREKWATKTMPVRKMINKIMKSTEYNGSKE